MIIRSFRRFIGRLFTVEFTVAVKFSVLQVFGVGTANPYRLRPYLGARVPVNSSFSPLINMHNPHSTPLQVITCLTVLLLYISSLYNCIFQEQKKKYKFSFQQDWFDIVFWFMLVNIKTWERKSKKKSNCISTYLHLHLFRSHLSIYFSVWYVSFFYNAYSFLIKSILTINEQYNVFSIDVIRNAVNVCFSNKLLLL